MLKRKIAWASAAITLFGLSIGIIFGQSFAKTLYPFDPSKNDAGSGENTKSTPKVVHPEKQLQDVPLDDFAQELCELRRFRNEGSLEELISEGNQIKRKWGSKGGDNYGKLAVEFLGILTSKRYLTDQISEFSREYASSVLQKADMFDLEVEWKLLLFLGSFDYAPSELNKVKLTQRSERVKLWLHAIMRLESTKDENFNSNDLPSLNVVPPTGTGLPAGVAPEAISDPKLRAEYERSIAENSRKIKYFNEQTAIRRQEKFFVEEGVEYISKAYSMPPFDIEELENILDDLRIPEDIQILIKSRVAALRKSDK